MNIPLEEKLDSTIYLTMKFGERHHLEAFQRGHIFCHSLDYYKNIENDGKPFYDSDEGLHAVYQSDQVELVLKTPKGQEIKINKDSGLVKNIRISKTISYPALCLHTLHTHGWNNTLNEVTLNELRDFLTPKIEMKKFGSHCLIILDGKEFNSRLFNAARKLGLATRHGVVRYVDTETAHGTISSEFVGFVKPNKFSSEREYRYIFEGNEISEPFQMDIGDLSDITRVITYEEFCEGFSIKLPETESEE